MLFKFLSTQHLLRNLLLFQDQLLLTLNLDHLLLIFRPMKFHIFHWNVWWSVGSTRSRYQFFSFIHRISSQYLFARSSVGLILHLISLEDLSKSVDHYQIFHLIFWLNPAFNLPILKLHLFLRPKQNEGIEDFLRFFSKKDFTLVPEPSSSLHKNLKVQFMPWLLHKYQTLWQ